VRPPPVVPPPLPRLALNLSPGAATRLLAGLGLAVALCATVATTLSLVVGVRQAAMPLALMELTNWLVSLPWLFLAVALSACARVERLVRPDQSGAWTALALVALAGAGLHVVGRDLVTSLTLVARAGLIAVAVAALSLLFRQFFQGPSTLVRRQMALGVFGGLLVGVGPFAMLGALLLPAAEHTGSLDALLSGSDALLGLVLGTFTIHATLVYVRDFLPDFTIALETANDGMERPLTVSRA
jgi:hypothetical protein